VLNPQDPDGYHLALEVSGKAQRELDQACLRAMVLVTDGLSLRSAGEDEAQTIVKSRLFYRYYLHFVKVLERSNASEVSEYTHRARTNIQVESFHPSRSISGRSVETKSTPEDASTLAIHALSNLLSANIDVGLKHCLSLGYHEDPALRTAFMQLLTNVLQQGARFGGLNAKRMSAASKPYLDCLTSGNMALAVALVEACPPGEIDEVSLLLQLAKVLVEREVTQTSESARCAQGRRAFPS
jgi:neurofibromin 1